MNWNTFVDALSLDEMNTLSIAIHDRRIKYATENMVPASENEIALVHGGEFISAIKAYRLRVGVGLFEAKLAMDVVRGR